MRVLLSILLLKIYTSPPCLAQSWEKTGAYSNQVEDSPSRNLQVLINSSWSSIPYPTSPACDRLQPHRDDPLAISVHIWKVDMSKEDFTAYVYWVEQIEIECYTSFWGVQVENVVQTSLKPYEAPLSPLNMTYLDLITLNTPVILRKFNDDHQCSWLRTMVHVHTRLMAVRCPIVFGFDGSILQPQGNWRKTSDLIYTDGYKTILIKPGSTDAECPLKIFKTSPGFISPEQEDPNVITVPDVSLLLTLNPNWDDIACKIKEEIVVFRTLGGYFLSLSSPNGTPINKKIDLLSMRSKPPKIFVDHVAPHRGTRSTKSISRHLNMESLLAALSHAKPHRYPRHMINMKTPSLQWNQIFDAGMRDTFDYASYRFAMDSILVQNSDTLKGLQISICSMRRLQWANLSPPDLAHKVAKYHTQTPYAFGVYSQGLFDIMSPLTSSDPYTLASPLKLNEGMYLIINNKTGSSCWIEPITGRTYESPIATFYSLSASWLPTTEGNQYFPLEDKVVITESAYKPLKRSSMPVARREISVYHQGEASTVQWGQMILSQSSTSKSWSPPSWIESAETYLFHIVFGVATALILSILAPCLCQCLSWISRTQPPEAQSYFRIRK